MPELTLIFLLIYYRGYRKEITFFLTYQDIGLDRGSIILSYVKLKKQKYKIKCKKKRNMAWGLIMKNFH